MKKNNIFFWLFLFIVLTTFYFDFNKTKILEAFKVKKINVYGIKNANINLINTRLEQFKNQNIFFLDQDKIALSIVNLDFIDNIRIKKIYPDKIKIQINEDNLIAIIIKNGNKYIISGKGEIIKNFNEKFSSLPIVYSENTFDYFPEFYEFLKKINFNINDIKHFKYFKSNRWDIFLKNGKLIKLPIDKDRLEKSIAKFISINQDKRFINFKTFDFRVKNQLIIK